MTLLLLISLIVAGMAGSISHELAHWFVWFAAGRRPELDLWRLEVRPTAGPQSTTGADRVAAAAPYLVGVSAATFGVMTSVPYLVVFGGFMVGIPSRTDVETLRGRAVWSVS